MDKDVALRWIKTAIVLLAMTNAGMNVGIFSPTLPDIGSLTHSSTAAMSTTLIWSGLSSMAGAILLGPLFDRYDGMGVLAAAVALQGVFMGLAPWCPELVGFEIIGALACFFNFGIMAGTFSVNCAIWQRQPAMIGPVVQVTDLMHALGTAITPQIVAPFLESGDASGTGVVNSSSNAVAWRSDVINDSVVKDYMTTRGEGLYNITATSAPGSHGVHPVQLAYVLIAIFDVVVAAVCLAMYLYARDLDDSTLRSYEYAKHRMIRRRSYSLNEDGTRLFADELEPRGPRERAGTGNLATMLLRRNFEAQRRNDATGNSDLRVLLQERRQQRQAQQQQEKGGSTGRARRGGHGAHGAHGEPEDGSVPELTLNPRMIALLVLIFFFFMFNGGRDALLTGLLFTYVHGLGWTATRGTLLVTFYHVTRVVVHILVVLLPKCVTPLRLTVANLLLLLASSGFMLATVHDSQVFLAIGVILTGFATSNINPTAITLAQRSFVVNGKTLGLFFGAMGCGQIVFAPVTGLLLQTAGSVSFPAMLLGLACGGATLLVPWVVTALTLKRQRQQQQEEESEGMGGDGACERTPLVRR